MAKVSASLSGDKAKVQAELYKKIMTSTESSPELRKEIARVFQVANRRAQNIEKAGYYSPALHALYLEGRTGYSKFGMKGHDWNSLKSEYGKAMAYLRNGTSTATGAKHYNNNMARMHNLTADDLREMTEAMTSGRTLSESDMLSRVLTYTGIMDLVHDKIEQAKRDMEAEAKRAIDEFENNLKNTANELSQEAADKLDSTLQNAVNALNDGIKI